MATVKAESNDKMVIRVMTENASKSRAEVVALLVEMLPEPPRVRDGKVTKEKWVQSYYNWGLNKGAPGEAAGKAPRAPKAPPLDSSEIPHKVKAVKRMAEEVIKKAKVQKVPAPRIAGDKEKPLVTDKTAEEIQDIKNKNLARMRAVGQKYATGQVANGKVGSFTKKEKAEALAYVAAVTDDLDSFKAPAFLSADEVKVLI